MLNRLNTSQRWPLVVAICAGLAGGAQQALATVSYVGGSYTQNFDSLTTTTHTTSSATFDPWTNDVTLPGWSLLRQPAPGTAITQYKGGDGSINTGFFYSFGQTGVAERALGGTASGGAYFGSPASAATAGWIAVGITNATAPITSFSIAYDGEQWRDGGTSNPSFPSVAQTMVMQYGFGATFAAVPTWLTPGGAFNFTSPTFGTTSTGLALNGNLPANRTAGLGGTISNLTWNPGDTLWIRWTEVNDVGNDHSLSIDNFQFEATVVPEPSSFLMAGVGAFGFVVATRRLRKRARSAA